MKDSKQQSCQEAEAEPTGKTQTILLYTTEVWFNGWDQCCPVELRVDISFSCAVQWQPSSHERRRESRNMASETGGVSFQF